ncbi:MAG TPA: outer membrane beta-barrel protein [Bryobacteraceae bacterium]|nr:outer membrane beta-barrel protein [Bryobacteraceae bacterium]
MSRKRASLAIAPAFAAFLAMSATVWAQDEVATPKYEVGVNYSYLHVNAASGDLSRNGNGGSGYFEYNLNRTVGLVGDVGGYANTASGKNDRLMTYMFGPRFNWRHSKLNPYVQFLFGGAYLWNNPNYSTTQNAFATAAGGGVDYALTKHFAIKPIQVEYVMTQINSANGFGSHQNDLRYSAGVVWRIGEK